MKNTPIKTNNPRNGEKPAPHKSPQSDKSRLGSQKQSTSIKERAVTDTKQPDYANQPIRKTDPSRYTEEE